MEEPFKLMMSGVDFPPSRVSVIRGNELILKDRLINARTRASKLLHPVANHIATQFRGLAIVAKAIRMIFAQPHVKVPQQRLAPCHGQLCKSPPSLSTVGTDRAVSVGAERGK